MLLVNQRLGRPKGAEEAPLIVPISDLHTFFPLIHIMVDTVRVVKPYLIYQSVDLAFDLEEEVIIGKTVLWLALSDEIPMKKNDVQTVFHIHCRQMRVLDVTVNGISTDFCHNDPLKSLLPDEKSHTFNARDADSAYRTALEVSRCGELRISIPYDEANWKFSSIARLPHGSPKEVIGRYEALQHLYHELKPKAPTSYSNQTDPSNVNATGDNEDSDEENILANIVNQAPTRDRGKLLQVRVLYSLDKKKSSPLGQQLSAGYSFRHSCHYNDGHGGFHNSSSRATCVFSTSGAKQNQSLYSVDGVRCWLPCLDSCDQRGVFDITLHSPLSSRIVLSSGKRLPRADHVACAALFREYLSSQSSTNKSLAQSTSRNFKSYRFFTPNRVPAVSLGFFVGSGESYALPLYKCRGKVFVAHGILDYDSRPRLQKQPYVDSKETVRVLAVDRPNGANEPPMKKLRFFSDVEDDDTDGRIDDDFDEDFPIESSHAYSGAVRHSMLGFDMSVRLIHKLLGRRYTHETYSQVYVPFLDGEFIAFDGFSLVDSKYLHESSAVYLETPHHLITLTSYLYTYFLVALPIMGYLNEYIIHGSVGYFLQLYLQAVYGEDESAHNMRKCLDAVTTLEKLHGPALPPIAPFSFPERYERFLPWFGVYLISKSTVLFQVIENRAGGSSLNTYSSRNILLMRICRLRCRSTSFPTLVAVFFE